MQMCRLNSLPLAFIVIGTLDVTRKCWHTANNQMFRTITAHILFHSYNLVSVEHIRFPEVPFLCHVSVLSVFRTRLTAVT